MVDRSRLDAFAPNDFLEPEEVAAFHEDRRIQEAGLLLHEMRDRAGLNETELAKRLGLANGDELLRIERGQLTESPSMTFMLRVAEICSEKIAVEPRAQRSVA
jgi:hypothetical protein